MKAEDFLKKTTRCTITEEAEDINENYYFQWCDAVNVMEDYAKACVLEALQQVKNCSIPAVMPALPTDEEISKEAYNVRMQYQDEQSKDKGMCEHIMIDAMKIECGFNEGAKWVKSKVGNEA